MSWTNEPLLNFQRFPLQDILRAPGPFGFEAACICHTYKKCYRGPIVTKPQYYQLLLRSRSMAYRIAGYHGHESSLISYRNYERLYCLVMYV